jgi:hypothetical protein
LTLRSIRAGQTIGLRSLFKDDIGDPTTVSGLTVSIFPPNIDTLDLGNAYLTSGLPVYWGNGIYQFDFSVPDSGPDGIWVDYWQGVMANSPVSGQFAFTVAASGIAQASSSQLFQNNVVEIVLASGLSGLDGTHLTSETILDFLTITKPAYTNIRKMRLEVGAFVKNLEDDTLQTAILEASLETDVLSFSKEIPTNVFYHARREYTTCLASVMLLNNTVVAGALRGKTLGDLSVQYDSAMLQKMIDRLRDCVDKWAPQIMAAGMAKAITQPQGVVKGELDPDRPISSRMWQSTDTGLLSRRMPMSNTRERPSWSRRYLGTYTKRWW